MKKILLTTFLVSSFLSGYSQLRFTDYQDFLQRKVVNEDSIRITGKVPDYNLYSEIFNPGASLKDVFRGEAYDRTNENLYFILKTNYYKIFIPEAHILFTVSPSTQDKDLVTHFIWLTGEIKKYKQESMTRTNY